MPSQMRPTTSATATAMPAYGAMTASETPISWKKEPMASIERFRP